MRGVHKAFVYIAVAVVAACVASFTGCSTSTHSGLPSHIRTVEVHIFQNKTMYKGIEGWITRDIIDRINMDPGVSVSSRNGDALITGEILDVRRQTLRETTGNEPGTVRITIDVEFSFYDNVKRRYIMEDVKLTSSTTGQFVGLYESSRGGSSEEGERSAAKRLAGEIVRRTVGMW